jgi:hypothetical protein
MAELTTEAAGTTAPTSSCCSAETQSSCCQPSEKAECCGETAADGSCGCSAGQAEGSFVVVEIRESHKVHEQAS